MLGVVPRIDERESVTRRGQNVHVEPMSDVAEAYRTVRTAVYFGSTGDECKTILVTSPAPGDGKSTCASNLAIAMAQAPTRRSTRICSSPGDWRTRRGRLPSARRREGWNRGSLS